ncbi:MAG TPA: MBL fold metallo-hydrolase [Candidatus Binatia bacterium]|nr:MBL fold metallo-hydrolase [Candidatus Binatia bacterium]
MKVTFYGTRGSCPVAHPSKIKYGGNTTCLRIESPCLPAGQWLVIDAGTGIVPLSADFVQSGGQEVTILQTHYHHDHTQGLALSTFPYLKQVPVHIYGPKDQGVGPREVYQVLMQPPYFPVDLHEVGSHLHCLDIEHPNSMVLLIHPQGGRKILTVEAFERITNNGGQIPFLLGTKFAVSECLVVAMHRSNHPERTIVYRFEERPSGLVFVFVTDHENQDGIPTRLSAHLQSANLLVMDTQYTRQKYEAMTAGWGHGTPDYTARVAKVVGAKALGLTHHDPASSDVLVDEIVETARRILAADGIPIPVFGCRDYMAVDVDNVAGALA